MLPPAGWAAFVGTAPGERAPKMGCCVCSLGCTLHPVFDS
jgi:hypothetical protein